MKREFSAGGIVFNKHKILLIRNSSIKNPKKSFWGFPKGHIEEGESSERAALREVKEEAGIDAQIVKKLGDSRYVYTRDGEKIFKMVTIYLMSYKKGKLKADPIEVLELDWFSKEECLAKLSFSKDKDLLIKAAEIMEVSS